MSKENIEADQEHHEEKGEEEQNSIENEVEEVEISESRRRRTGKNV